MVKNATLYFGFGNASPYYLYKYDLVDLEVSQLVSRPVAWNYPHGRWDGGSKIYIAGSLGSDYSEHCSVYPYDIINNSFGSELSNTGFSGYTYTGACFDIDCFNRLYLLKSGVSGSSYFMAEDSWSDAILVNFPGSAALGAQCICIPINATNKAGYLFYLRSNSAYLYYIDPRVDSSWTSAATLPATKNFAGAVWVGEYIFALATTGELYKYDVSANSWSTKATCPKNSYFTRSGNLATDGNINGFLYAFNCDDKIIYKYDIDENSWDTLVNLSAYAFGSSFISYVPQIRFDYLDSDGATHLDDPFAINNAEQGTPGTAVKRYLKALEAVNGVTIQVKSDSRGDDDNLLQVADDSDGAPGTWGSSADLGNFTENEKKAFWLRANPAAGSPIGKRACKIEVIVA